MAGPPNPRARTTTTPWPCAPQGASASAAYRTLIYVIVAAALVRLLMLALYPLMDTTEARYAEIARIMVELDDWVTPWFDYGVPFWGKPPLSFWLTAASFKLFGVNEFAARLPHWLAGVLVAGLVWGLSARRSRQEAVYVMALLVGSTLYFVAAGAVMTDMALTVGATLTMRGFWLGLHGAPRERARERWMVFIGLGIGLLAKGPIAVVLSALPIGLWILISKKPAAVWRGLPWFRGILVVLVIALPWYLLAEARTPGFLEYFLVGEHWQRFVVSGWEGDLYGSAHEYPRGTIWLFLFADLLPWTILLPVFILWRHKTRTVHPADREDRRWRHYLLLWGLMPAVFFSFAGNILWPYVLPGIPALALWVGGWLARQPGRRRVERMLTGGVIFTVLVASAVVASLPITGRGEDKSAKALVAEYEARRKPGQKLIYLGQRPFSAAFYSHGKAESVPSAGQLVSRLERTSAFVAIENGDARRFPAALGKLLTPVNTHGRFTLYIGGPDVSDKS